MLYFVDSIYHSADSEEKNVVVTLLRAENENNLNGEEEDYPLILTLRSEQLQYDYRGGHIQEGWYVNYTESPNRNGFLFSYANRTRYAREQITLNNNLRNQLLQESENFRDLISDSDLEKMLYHSEIRSYHVNVGHGNCSFILIQSQLEKGYQLWNIDTSIYEGSNRAVGNTNHQQELDACLQQIASDAGIQLKDLHIHRFFLTHMHFDHYNGLLYLVQRGYINSDTICYMNLHYQMASSRLNAVLQQMVNKRIYRIVEPLLSNSSPVIQILYPECTIFRNKATAAPSKTYRVEKKVNNSSCVIRFNLGRRSMTYTGDIEQDGMRGIAAYLPYPPYACTDYYVASHHGSLNGHPYKFNCMAHPFCHISCCLPRIALIMGRNGAYCGIFSQKVIQDLNVCHQLVLTDSQKNGHPIKFLCIEWFQGLVSSF